MRRAVAWGLVLGGLITTQVWADFRYTEEMRQEMKMPQMNFPGMPGGMMPQNQLLSAKTILVKGGKQRVDYHKDGVSTITRCDRKLRIVLNHARKIYTTQPLEQQAARMKEMCQSLSQAPAAMPKPAPAKPGQLVMKTVITDLHQQEPIGRSMAKKYVREFSVSGNPSCMPDMQMKEYVWAIDLKPETFQCALLPQVVCPNLPSMPEQMPCMKNMKVVQQGLAEVPGFVVRRELVMDMAKMMGGAMPDMGDGDEGLPFDMGSMSMKTVTIITNVSRDPLPDSLFEVPQDYRQDPNYHPQGYEDL